MVSSQPRKEPAVATNAAPAETFARLARALNHIRCHDWTIPSARYRVFLAIAASPGITMPDMLAMMRREGDPLSDSAVQRHVSALSSPETAQGRKGVSVPLVQLLPCIDDGRAYQLYLTAEGVSVARQILETMKHRG